MWRIIVKNRVDTNSDTQSHSYPYPHLTCQTSPILKESEPEKVEITDYH